MGPLVRVRASVRIDAHAKKRMDARMHASRIRKVRKSIRRCTPAKHTRSTTLRGTPSNIAVPMSSRHAGDAGAPSLTRQRSFDAQSAKEALWNLTRQLRRL